MGWRWPFAKFDERKQVIGGDRGEKDATWDI